MGNIETLLSTLGERIGGHADVWSFYICSSSGGLNQARIGDFEA